MKRSRAQQLGNRFYNVIKKKVSKKHNFELLQPATLLWLVCMRWKSFCEIEVEKIEVETDGDSSFVNLSKHYLSHYPTFATKSYHPQNPPEPLL